MRRSAKYGLYAAVVAALVAGVLTWTRVDKSVTLEVDGANHRVHTTANSVRDVLDVAGYPLGGHDLVAPGPTARVANGERIVLRRGRLLDLTIDGQHRQVWTVAPTVAQALAQLGYPAGSFVSVSRSTRLPLSQTSLTVRIPCAVSVVHDGRTDRVSSTAPTVAALLRELNITLGPADKISVPTATSLIAGERIVIERVNRRVEIVRRSVPFATKQQFDATLPIGEAKQTAAGQTGLIETRYALVYLDGRLVSRTKIGTNTVRRPLARVISIGTRQGSGTVAPGPAAAMAIAQQLMAQRGWGADQFQCLVTLWGHESGWRVNAANPSGAYGIPQALPGSKMGSYGPDWQSNPQTQISWGLNYIATRYHDPCQAWATWQAHGGWY